MWSWTIPLERKLSEERGSVLVEFVLVLPIFLLILFFVSDIVIYSFHRYMVNHELGKEVRKVTMSLPLGSNEDDISSFLRQRLSSSENEWVRKAEELDVSVSKVDSLARGEGIYEVKVGYKLKVGVLLPELLGMSKNSYSCSVKVEPKRGL